MHATVCILEHMHMRGRETKKQYSCVLNTHTISMRASIHHGDTHTANPRIIDVRCQLSTVFSTSLLLESR
jgi:hypothetical protein